MRASALGAAGLLLLAACERETAAPAAEAPAAEVPGCTVERANGSLAEELTEASGVEFSAAHPGVLWTHNDSGEPLLYAIGADGAVVGRVRVEGARLRDWEDLAAGPCPSGTCLHVADIGDNRNRRDSVVVYRVPEPDPAAAHTAPAEAFPFRYPDGPRDAEALFVLPSGALYVVSKGRDGPPTLYRYPGPLRAGETVTLETVAPLAAGTPEPRDLVTGAASTPDGAWVAVRTYRSVAFHRAADLAAGRTEPARRAALDGLGELQGEGIALRDDGALVTTGEGGFEGAAGTISVLACEL